jgi:hypothetical protein
VPSGLDGVALKQWLGAHQDDHTVAAAMQACAGGDAGNCGDAAKPAPSGDQPAETAKQPGS